MHLANNMDLNSHLFISTKSVGIHLQAGKTFFQQMVTSFAII